MTEQVTEQAADAPEQTLYERIGGETVVRELVDRFYDLMELEPEFAGIREMHPTPMDSSRDKLFWFLSGWMGGPPLFTDKYGHPMLRKRHLHFPIDSGARDQWMLCMRQALEETVADPALQSELYAAFLKVAAIHVARDLLCLLLAFRLNLGCAINDIAGHYFKFFHASTS